MKTDLAVGEAGSLLRAARHLQDRLNGLVKLPNSDAVAVQLAGCFFSAIMLRAFAVEVSLKGSYHQETGEEPDRTHDLSELFNQLSPAVRNSLGRRFHRRRQGEEYGSTYQKSFPRCSSQIRNNQIGCCTIHRTTG